MSLKSERIRQQFKGKITKDNQEEVVGNALIECAKHLYVVFHAAQVPNRMMVELDIEGERYRLEFKKLDEQKA